MHPLADSHLMSATTNVVWHSSVSSTQVGLVGVTDQSAGAALVGLGVAVASADALAGGDTWAVGVADHVPTGVNSSVAVAIGEAATAAEGELVAAVAGPERRPPHTRRTSTETMITAVAGALGEAARAHFERFGGIADHWIRFWPQADDVR